MFSDEYDEVFTNICFSNAKSSWEAFYLDVFTV